MSLRERVLILVGLLALLAVGRVGGSVVDWYRYRDERVVLRGLDARLNAAGLQVVRTRARADTLCAQLEQTDRALDRARRGVALYDRFAIQGAVPGHLYGAYRSEVDTFNARVYRRNARLQRWQELVRSNRQAVGRYNALVDSVRMVAARMGEPYYPIRTPAELAAEQGLVSLGQ